MKTVFLSSAQFFFCISVLRDTHKTPPAMLLARAAAACALLLLTASPADAFSSTPTVSTMWGTRHRNSAAAASIRRPHFALGLKAQLSDSPGAPAEASSAAKVTLQKDDAKRTMDAGEEMDLDINPPLEPSTLRFGYPRNLDKSNASPPSKATKPLLLYLPGLDGTQLFAEPQFHDLESRFELRVLTIPSDDRHDFDGLVKAISSYLKGWCDASKECSDKPMLMGESTGGLVAVGVALHDPKVLHSMLLVSPATSYKETVWPILGRFLAAIPDLTPLGSERLPSIIDRINANAKETAQGLGLLPNVSIGELAFAGFAAPLLALAAIDQKQAQKYAAMAGSRAQDIVSGGIERGADEALGLAKEGIEALEMVLSIMPPAAVKHRLNKVLMAGCDSIEGRLGDVSTPTLVLYGKDDNLLPSRDEAKKLTNMMQNCKKKEIENAGHLTLDSPAVNCSRIIESTKSVAPMSWRKDPVMDWEVPSKEKIEEAAEGTNGIRRLASPIFLSTGPGGNVEVGLRNLRTSVLNKGKPVLFVGNHQLLALDLSLMLEGVWRETGTLLRGLAHPMLFQGIGGVPGVFGAANGGDDGGNMYETFGAVPVSGRNAHKLLARGDAVLLFPGGISEAMHGKDEYYKLKWPEKTDFVRLAARFNATIVPFGGVGASEASQVVMDASETKEFGESPVGKALGSLVGGSEAGGRARAQTFGAEGLNAERLTMSGMPIVVPKPPWEYSRFYFMFGEPFSTDDVSINDPEQCAAVYKDVQESVKDILDYVLENRDKDPYKDLSSRLVYETTYARAAPTFNPPRMSSSKAKTET